MVDLEKRARDMLAEETRRAHEAPFGAPTQLWDIAIRAIVAALRQQPAPADLEQFREAVQAIDDFVFHRERCGFPHQICDCGMKEARVRLLSIIELCPCGEATCTESWEPGCGLGESIEHAVPAEREPPRGDELRAILSHQPAPVVDDAMVGRAIVAYHDAGGAPSNTWAMRAALTAALSSVQGVGNG